MEATSQNPLVRVGGDGVRGATLAWLVGYAIPLLLDRVLAGKDFPYDDSGNGCRGLTDAGQAAFAHAALGLRLALAAWALAGVGIVLVAWLRRLEGGTGAWVTIGAWTVAGAGAVYHSWFTPLGDGLSKGVFAVIALVFLVGGSSLAMTIGLLVRRGEGHRPFLLGLLLRSQAVLIAVVVAGAFLGGNGEIPLC